MKQGLLIGLCALLTCCAGPDRMSPAHPDTETVVRSYIVDFWTNKDTTVIAQLFPQEIVYHYNGQTFPFGWADHIGALNSWSDVFSEVQGRVDVFVIDGQFAGAATTWSSRHTGLPYRAGPTDEIQASGCKIEWAVNYLFRIENGRIAELWETWDAGGFTNSLRHLADTPCSS